MYFTTLVSVPLMQNMFQFYSKQLKIMVYYFTLFILIAEKKHRMLQFLLLTMLYFMMVNISQMSR